MKVPKLLVTLLLALSISGSLLAQAEKAASPQAGEKKALREDIRSEMKVMDDRLDKLVVDMNAAVTPDQKIDAVIAVINEMVAQHKKIHQRMAEHGAKHHD